MKVTSDVDETRRIVEKGPEVQIRHIGAYPGRLFPYYSARRVEREMLQHYSRLSLWFFALPNNWA